MDEIRQKLRQMVKSEGADVVTLGGICEMLLNKHLPDYPEAVRALAHGVESGVAKQILKTPNAMAREMLMPNWQQTLIAGGQVTKEEARWIIDSWAAALEASPAAARDQHEGEEKEAPPADVDAVLYLLLFAGVGIHVLALMGFSFTYQFMLEGEELIRFMPMEEMLANLYMVFMPVSVAVSLMFFSLALTLYGQDMPLERVLRNFFCLFAYSSGVFCFVIMMGWYVGIIVGGFLAMGTFAWLIQFFGFRVYILASLMHLFQYVTYAALVLLTIIPALHTYGAEFKEEEFRRGLKQFGANPPARSQWVAAQAYDLPLSHAASGIRPAFFPGN